ncbi:SDR family oxidoreductase [Sorangium sp. So ce1128]
MRLKGKTAFITGGNGGIGFATARLFVAEGAKVTITGRSQRTLDAAAAELGPSCLAVQADVQDVPSIERAVARAVEAFGKLDIVFANAGISGATPVGETSLAATTIPLRRMGEAEEAAAVALFLASDESSNVTAAEIVVDGGMTGAPFGAPVHGAR